MEPEWIVTTEDKSEPMNVKFKDIYAIKDKITSLMALWDTCSYYVNIKDLFFIIRGGKSIQVPGLSDFVQSRLFYAKRNTQSFSTNTHEEVQRTQTILMGIEGLLNNEQRVLYLEILPDGSQWRWKHER